MVKHICFALVFIILCACSTPNPAPAPTTVATIATTPALEALVQTWIAEVPAPGVARFELRTLAPLEVPQAIEDDTVQLAIVGSAPLDDAFVTPLFDEGIAVVVHTQNAIRSLSLEELEGLFSGRISNWSELDAEDLAVQPVIPLSADETRTHFEQLVMEDKAASVKALLAPTPAAMIQLVSENPGAIGYLSFSSLSDEVRAVQVDNRSPSSANVRSGRYPLILPVIAYASEEPQGALRDWILAIQAPVETATP
ncbi:MAG: substrate-binding domain-containing protein [Anaerolineales bacterium]